MTSRRFFFPLLLSIALTASSTSFGNDGWFVSHCKSLLQSIHKRTASPTSAFGFEEWRAVYWDARDHSNEPAAAYALTHLLRFKSGELKLSFSSRRALNILARAFEDPEEVQQASLDIPLLQRIKNAVKFRWVSPFLKTDAAGLPLSRLQQVSRPAKILAADFAWSFGPFGYRLGYDWLKRLWGRHLTEEVIDRVVVADYLQSVLGIPDDVFARHLFKKYFGTRTVDKAIKNKNRGNLIRPALILATLLSASNFMENVTGYRIAPRPLVEWVRADLPDYPQGSYIRDLQNVTGRSYRDKKVTFIIDKHLMDHFFWNTPTAKYIDPRALAQVQYIKYLARDFNVVAVGSIKELSTALESARDSDFVFVDIHGSPGSFTIEGEVGGIRERMSEITAGRLKKGSTLVLLPCSFGDVYNSDNHGLEQETWVKFANKLLGEDGIAVASTNTLLFSPLLLPIDLGEPIATSKTDEKAAAPSQTGPSNFTDFNKSEGGREIMTRVVSANFSLEPGAMPQSGWENIGNALKDAYVKNAPQAISGAVYLAKKYALGIPPSSSIDDQEEALTRVYGGGGPGLRIYDYNTHTATYYSH